MQESRLHSITCYRIYHAPIRSNTSRRGNNCHWFVIQTINNECVNLHLIWFQFRFYFYLVFRYCNLCIRRDRCCVTPGKQHEDTTRFWRFDWRIEYGNGHCCLSLHGRRIFRLSEVWGKCRRQYNAQFGRECRFSTIRSSNDGFGHFPIVWTAILRSNFDNGTIVSESIHW